MTIERTDAVFAVVCAATPETMSREQIGDHVVRLRRLRSWLDAQDVRVARRTAELEAAGQSESVETLAARTGGRSGRDARDLTRRTTSDPIGPRPTTRLSMRRGVAPQNASL